MKELVEYIARSLVDDPTQIQVKQKRVGSGVHLELSVHKNDMGRMIGKGGRVANSTRILLRVLAAREGKQVTLDVVEQR